jgi:GNAT superfamily N-acetyltransferase
VTVRPCTESECADVAAIHVEALPGEVLSLLGESFLASLYRGIARQPGGFTHVAERDGAIVGFVSGATDAGIVSRAAIRQQWVSLAVAATARVVTRPSLMIRALEVFRRRSRRDEANTRAELLSIAVRAPYRGEGVGRALVESFDTEMRRRHVDFYQVMTTGGADVRAFYTKAGFVPLEEFDVPGARAHRFGRRLSAP